jgi:hypothetical protein
MPSPEPPPACGPGSEVSGTDLSAALPSVAGHLPWWGAFHQGVLFLRGCHGQPGEPVVRVAGFRAYVPSGSRAFAPATCSLRSPWAVRFSPDPSMPRGWRTSWAPRRVPTLPSPTRWLVPRGRVAGRGGACGPRLVWSPWAGSPWFPPGGRSPLTPPHANLRRRSHLSWSAGRAAAEKPARAPKCSRCPHKLVGLGAPGKPGTPGTPRPACHAPLRGGRGSANTGARPRCDDPPKVPGSLPTSREGPHPSATTRPPAAAVNGAASAAATEEPPTEHVEPGSSEAQRGGTRETVRSGATRAHRPEGPARARGANPSPPSALRLHPRHGLPTQSTPVDTPAR